MGATIRRTLAVVLLLVVSAQAQHNPVVTTTLTQDPQPCITAAQATGAAATASGSKVCPGSTTVAWVYTPPPPVMTFPIGSQVQTTSQVNVRGTAGGSLLGTQATGAVGTVTAGTVSAPLNGTVFKWSKVDFPTNPDGYVGEDTLRLYVPPVPTAPSVTTSAPSNITTVSVVLNGIVNAHNALTTAHWDYGPTTAYGSSSSNTTIAATSTGSAALATLSALTCATGYHYRLTAVNSAGTANSADGLVTTSPCAALPTVTLNKPATLQANHDGLNTDTYTTFIDSIAVTVGTPKATALANGVLSLPFTSTALGTHIIQIEAVGPNGATRSVSLAFSTAP